MEVITATILEATLGHKMVFYKGKTLMERLLVFLAILQIGIGIVGIVANPARESSTVEVEGFQVWFSELEDFNNNLHSLPLVYYTFQCTLGSLLLASLSLDGFRVREMLKRWLIMSMTSMLVCSCLFIFLYAGMEREEVIEAAVNLGIMFTEFLTVIIYWKLWCQGVILTDFLTQEMAGVLVACDCCECYC